MPQPAQLPEPSTPRLANTPTATPPTGFNRRLHRQAPFSRWRLRGSSAQVDRLFAELSVLKLVTTLNVPGSLLRRRHWGTWELSGRAGGAGGSPRLHHTGGRPSLTVHASGVKTSRPCVFSWASDASDAGCEGPRERFPAVRRRGWSYGCRAVPGDPALRQRGAEHMLSVDGATEENVSSGFSQTPAA